MLPLVSVLIPAYNSEPWIGETIRSVLDQTWPNLEIVVVDDGSKDGTLSILENLRSEKLKVVQQKNGGASAARNKAYELCQGDYIQWLDADDLLSPDKIEKQMEVALKSENERKVISSPWGHFFFLPQRAKFERTPLWEDLSPADWLVRKLGQSLHMQTATWLVSREITEAAGPWDGRLMSDDDGEYFCRVLLNCEGVCFVPEARVYYRLSSAGSWGNMDFSRKKLEAQWLAMQMHIDYLLSLEKSERVNEAAVKYLQTWFNYYYPEHADLVRQFREKAESLGGELFEPELSWKYAWIRKVFGWKAAKRARRFLLQSKTSLFRGYDKLMAAGKSQSL